MIQIIDNQIRIDVPNSKIAIIDGQTYELVDGKILIANRPTSYDITVYGILEENHIPRPEPEIVEESIVTEPEVITPQEQSEI